jgi:hypothetical protein
MTTPDTTKIAATYDAELDRPIIGARDIAIAAGIVDEAGEADLDSAYYHLGRGNIPAGRMGKLYVSTLRQIIAMASGRR